MAVNQISLAQITNQLLQFNAQFNQLMNLVGLFYTDVVTGIGLAGLQAAPYSLSTADAQSVMNAVTDMFHFFQVYQGLMYVASGATLNSGVPTANDASHFGYPFDINIAKVGGIGF